MYLNDSLVPFQRRPGCADTLGQIALVPHLLQVVDVLQRDNASERSQEGKNLCYISRRNAMIRHEHESVCATKIVKLLSNPQ